MILEVLSGQFNSPTEGHPHKKQVDFAMAETIMVHTRDGP